MDSQKLFSKKRLDNFKDETEHRDNFLLMQSLSAKLGVIEIVTRNRILNTLKSKNRLKILDDLVNKKITDYDQFVSQQTFGFWGRVINCAEIHNDLIKLDIIDFRKYAQSNRKKKFYNYQKVRIAYDLLVTIRNRAFHFENLYKTKTIIKNNEQIQVPRISTIRNGETIGIMPNKLNDFLDDILLCFDKELKDYLESGGKEQAPAFNFIRNYIKKILIFFDK